MEATTQINAAVELFGRLGIGVRREHLGGEGGGGLCTIRGQRVFFLDLDADLATRAEQSLAALAGLPEAEGVYVTPALRELLEQMRK